MKTLKLTKQKLTQPKISKKVRFVKVISFFINEFRTAVLNLKCMYSKIFSFFPFDKKTTSLSYPSYLGTYIMLIKVKNMLLNCLSS